MSTREYEDPEVSFFEFGLPSEGPEVGPCAQSAYAASVLREPSPGGDEEAWMHDAAARLNTRFREALYGVYAVYEEPERGSRPSWPNRR